MLGEQRKNGVMKEILREAKSSFVLSLSYGYCDDYEYDEVRIE
jgi:hypothetical protein